MRPFLTRLAAMLWLLPAVFAMAQTQPQPQAQQPVDVNEQFLPSQGARPRFETGAKTSLKARVAIQQGRSQSVPTFSKGFMFQGRTFPFTMVGGAPNRGETTRIRTQMIPISLFFEGFVDAKGEPIVLEAGDALAQTLNSPNFHAAQYQTGFTQFADAVQRAEFFGSMGAEWHTLLRPPEMLKPVMIDVPRGMANVYRMSNGKVFAIVDTAFFISQLNTIIQTENLEVEALPIALTTNVLLAPGAQIQHCCTLGFHTAFDTGEQGDTVQVQTFVWASWLDSGIFAGAVADVTPLSHEISEWMNNPFSTNIVPEWAFPNGNGGCEDGLESGDPVALFSNAGFSVPIDGFTYHPQSEALLQWFQRGQTSDAIDGAFSFPDASLLTAPSQACASR